MNGRVRIGKLPIDRVTFDDALVAVERLVDEKKGGTVFTPNVDHIVMAEHDATFRAAYEAASLSLVDGTPVLWASRALGDALPEKISGSDFAPALLEVAAKKKWRIYLLGGAEGSAEKAAKVLEERGVKVVGFSSPRVTVSASADAHAVIADEIIRAAPDVILVALGAPKQELFSYAIAERVRPAVLLGVGATIDFLAGAVPRAPAWVSRSGLEWLYRLGREPRRLWRRYLIRDPEFALVVLRQMRNANRENAPRAEHP